MTFSQNKDNIFSDFRGLLKLPPSIPDTDCYESLVRQMRGLPPFEDENRAYYYLRLYRGIRL